MHPKYQEDRAGCHYLEDMNNTIALKGRRSIQLESAMRVSILQHYVVRQYQEDERVENNVEITTALENLLLNDE
ncbi:hypothetical protein PPTG_21836 [Phytophthora nicotianae INRA-310]|uniref:Uncharacterized protein n=1 Tax=Phytophthora nicotianae (strain INRA-310) TaxID=761204 RepID=W2QTT9_PHYN3|nr:hypothetical protein PPTG_21836 [Phytophthora nicotianae INRA-310]ETN15909.1 hypothetical protein PPTG_21836 [Phytophthora nicotianae INRA-310]